MTTAFKKKLEKQFYACVFSVFSIVFTPTNASDYSFQSYEWMNKAKIWSGIFYLISNWGAFDLCTAFIWAWHVIFTVFLKRWQCQRGNTVLNFVLRFIYVSQNYWTLFTRRTCSILIWFYHQIWLIDTVRQRFSIVLKSRGDSSLIQESSS